MKQKKIIEELKEDFKEIIAIRSYLWANGINDGLDYVFVVYISKKYNVEAMKDILSHIRSKELKDVISRRRYDSILDKKVLIYLHSYSIEILKKTISMDVSRDRKIGTIQYPDSYMELINKFISQKDKQKLLLVNSPDIINRISRGLFSNYTKINCFEREFSIYVKMLIKAEVLESNIAFDTNEFFNTDRTGFDTILLFFNSRELSKEEIEVFLQKHPFIEKSKTSECFNLIKAMETLNDNGETIAFVSAGFVSNQSTGDISCRKFLCENKYIKTVVALPENTISYMGIRMAMLVLTKTPNDSISFVDATSECEKSRVINKISSDNVLNIYNASCKNSEISKTIKYEDLDDNYRLNPDYYLGHQEVSFEGVEDNIEIAESATVIRGSNAIQKELDNRYSITDTNFKVLSASWDNDRMIPDYECLRSLQEIRETEEKYVLQEGDFVISKMGNPKFDVVDNLGNRKVLVTGNLYIVRFDKTKLHPKYVKCFFESSEGYNLLENALTGSLTLTLSIEMLKKIKIPLIPMEKQLLIVKEYEFLEMMKKECYEKIKKIDRRYESLFGDALNGKVKYFWTEDGDILL